MLLLTEKELKWHQDATECYICWKIKIIKRFSKEKDHQKIRDHCYYAGKWTTPPPLDC